MICLNSLGKRIAYLRKRSNLTQRQLMNILDFENLSRYENDERKPNIDIIVKLSKHFKISTDWILTGQEHKSYKNFQHKIELDDNEKNFIKLFDQLTEFEKGQIIGRMEQLIEMH